TPARAARRDIPKKKAAAARAACLPAVRPQGVNCAVVSIRTARRWTRFAAGSHSSTVACKFHHPGLAMPTSNPAASTLMSRLGLTTPIIQAPMAGTSTPALAAAVSNAGGLGSLGLGATNADGARQAIAQTRALTARPFGVNLFCHAPDTADAARQ